MIRPLTENFIRFILLILVQVLILNHIQFSGYLNPFIYVLFILLLPFETPNWLLLILAFFCGLIVDAFSDTMGMHASASVFMAFLRPFVLKIFSPREGYEPGSKPTVQYYGVLWFVRYTAVLVFLHHLFLFYIEVFRFTGFFYTFLKVILSSFVTLSLILLSQAFFYNKKLK